MKYIWIFMMAVTIASCSKKESASDATGTFEVDEVLISAQSNGVLLNLNVEEGQYLTEDSIYGELDSMQLYLKKRQLLAQKKVVLSRLPDEAAQLSALNAQEKQARHEMARIDKLFASKAATEKQRDDAHALVDVIGKQILALESSLKVSKSSLLEELMPLQIQIEQIEDQLSKCKVTSPFNGTVLVRYANKGEMMNVGKPIFKMADLNKIYLRAYVTGDQFSKIKLGQTVKVLVDDGDGNYKELSGRLTWISDKAEFTPKTIQTKDERANLVYAIKILVKNDGLLKSGMYGEVKF